MRLLEATQGAVYFEGNDILKYDKRQMRKLRREMQIIFQDPFSSLDPRMTVSQIIEQPLQIHRVFTSKRETQARVSELMDTVGLSERYYNAYPHELDGGRRQRIGIARALALNPKFIVCDEPVSALDVSIQAQILNLMQDLQESFGLTYLFITHDLSVVRHISDDIAVMYLGQLVEKAPAKELFQQPLHPYTQGLLSAIPVPSLRHRRERIILKGEISSPIDPSPGCRFAKRCIYATEACLSNDIKLTEVNPRHSVACILAQESQMSPA